MLILRNSAKCSTCGTEIVSRSRHDYVVCPCRSVAVDGGNEYLRRVGDGYFEDTSVVADSDEPRRHPLEHSDLTVEGVHHSAICAGGPCPIHHRSDHPLRWMAQTFFDGRCWRVCLHGERHPDPDDPAGTAGGCGCGCGCCKKGS
jgi:hypothetical protein